MVTTQSKLRIERARCLISQLEEEIDTFSREFHGKYRVSLDQETGIANIEVNHFELELPAVLSIYIGEIVLNLRASLDYLIYNLAIVDSGKIQRRTQFPLCSTRRDYKKKKDTALKGLNDENIQKIEKYQPYKEGGILKKLEELSNIDKHRHLVFLEGDSEFTFTIKKMEEGFDTKVEGKMKLCFGDKTPVIDILNQIESYVSEIISDYEYI